ncbi:MAG: DEAD/DEAH box helicase [Phycisphaeraceae bacterium]|nr:DEAD/DEAH box helicase [Phycisphaeraceae bacterium]
MTGFPMIHPDDIFDTTIGFADLALSDPVRRAIDDLGFVHPTLAQAQIIPLALTGRDILGQSKTGTGKTLAFAVPAIEALKDRAPFGALVLCPTRELAIQVAQEFRNLTKYTDLKVAAIYGGQPMRQQGPKLAREPDIIVGTPGRVMDFHRRGALPYDRFRFVVLDEVDRMLDIGFREDIRRILGGMTQAHQTILVSATISDEIERLARKYLKDPVKFVLTAKSLTVQQVEQRHFAVEPWDKSRLLVHLLTHEEPALTVVFCRTKQTVDALTEFLRRKKIDAQAIHGDLHQGQRNKVMEKLRGGELKVLIASDLAARGLDVDDISHVVNFDLPEDPEVYVHRIGRTARAGRKGIAWSFVSPGDGALLSQIEQLTNVEIQQQAFTDFEPGPVPEAVLRRRAEEQTRRETQAAQSSRMKTELPPAASAVDAARFPDGLVPRAMPTRRLGGRLRTRRR